MNDQKHLLLETISSNRNLYDCVQVKGVIVRHQNNLYPIELIFVALPKGQKQIQNLDYSEFLFIEDTLTIKQFKEFIKNIGEQDTTLSLSNIQIIIPKGLFRYIDDDRTQKDLQMKILNQSGPLDEIQRNLLSETRSYPNSIYQAWPSKVFLYQYNNSDLTAYYYNKLYLRLPLKKGLPVLPSLRDAVNWWLGRNGMFHSLNILFYLPNYTARIKEVKFSRNKFILSIESKIIKNSRLLGKYFLEYTSFPIETHDIKITSESTFDILVKDKINKFYFVLIDSKNPTKVIDYRNYDFTRRDRIDLDYVIDEEDIGYRISQGENETTEFKVDLEDSHEEFLETVCSFSNSWGGVIILGVDNKGNIKGIADDRIEMQKDKILKVVRDWTEPLIAVQIKPMVIKNKKLLIINIQKGKDTPYNYINHGFYIRAGSTDRIATRDELLSLTPDEELGQIISK